MLGFGKSKAKEADKNEALATLDKEFEETITERNGGVPPEGEMRERLTAELAAERAELVQELGGDVDAELARIEAAETAETAMSNGPPTEPPKGEMTTGNSELGLLDVIDSWDDNDARIAAYRGVVHGSLSRCIGAIRQTIRNREMLERNKLQEQIRNDLDERNETDEQRRGEEEVRKAMGFQDNRIPPEQLASLYHSVYRRAYEDLMTLVQDEWDRPLDVAAMLSYMVENTSPLSPSFIEALAKATGLPPNMIKEINEVQNLDESIKLKESMPEIVSTFKSFDKEARIGSLYELPVVDHHQLSIKAFESLRKALDRVFRRTMRRQSLMDIGMIPIYKQYMEQLTQWIKGFERKHRDELMEALENGANLRTIDDVKKGR